jgi:hypothetical protein
MAEDKKKKLLGGLLDVLGGTLETPLTIGTALSGALTSGLEAGGAALDWSDRPEWLLGGEGSEGMPFWNKEQGAEQFNEALDRWVYKPKTKSGQASSAAVGDALGLIDWPFAEFGRGIEGLSGSKTAGDIGYWGTAVGGPGLLRLPGLVRRGIVASLAPEAKLYRKNWYGSKLGQASHYARMPADMIINKLKGFFHPQTGFDASRGFSRMDQLRKFESEIDRLKKLPSTKENRVALAFNERQYLGEISKEYAMRRQYGVPIPPELQQAAKGIFPNEVQLTAHQLLADPQALTKITGVNISDDMAAHITPYIVSEYDAVARGIPLNLAHKVESQASTGSMMGRSLKAKINQNVLKHGDLIDSGWPTLASKTQTKLNKKGDPYRATVSKQPLESMEQAWDAALAKRSQGLRNKQGDLYYQPNHKFTAQDFVNEIDQINTAKKVRYQRDIDLRAKGLRLNSKGKEVKLQYNEDGSIRTTLKPPVFLHRPGIGNKFNHLKDGGGFVSWGYSGLTPDPLLGTVAVRTILNPETGQMFKVSMDQLALGMNPTVGKVTRPGMKNQFISLTTQHDAFRNPIRTKYGLGDEQMQALLKETTGKLGTAATAKREVASLLDEGLATGTPNPPLALQGVRDVVASHKGPSPAEIRSRLGPAYGYPAGMYLARTEAHTDRKRKRPPQQGLLGPY